MNDIQIKEELDRIITFMGRSFPDSNMYGVAFESGLMIYFSEN